jgi:hypothetical protein
MMDPGLDSLAAIAYAKYTRLREHEIAAALAFDKSMTRMWSSSLHALGSSMWRMQYD